MDFPVKILSMILLKFYHRDPIYPLFWVEKKYVHLQKNYLVKKKFYWIWKYVQIGHDF